MKFLRYLAGAFIDTFGITRPPSDGQNRAALYIAALLVGLILLLSVAIAAAVRSV